MTKDEALRRAAALCARSEQCTAAIRDKLVAWEADDADAVLRELCKEGYIDDGRYARAFVADKLRYNHWGRVKLRAALRQKGIDSDTISAAIGTIDPDEYADVLQHVLRAKERTLHDSDEYVRRQKLARHAASHGFEAGLVFDVLG